MPVHLKLVANQIAALQNIEELNIYMIIHHIITAHAAVAMLLSRRHSANLGPFPQPEYNLGSTL
jgi:hypothetical protein